MVGIPSTMSSWPQHTLLRTVLPIFSEMTAGQAGYGHFLSPQAFSNPSRRNRPGRDGQPCKSADVCGSAVNELIY